NMGSVLRRQLVGLQHQALDPSPILDVGLEDLVDVLCRLVAVPHALGIDYHVVAVFAAIEAAGSIQTDALDAELSRLLARIAAYFLDTAHGCGAGHTATPRMAFRPHIGAHKDMALVEQPRVGGRI